MKKHILITVLALAALFTSCRKDRFEGPKAPEKMEELTVPANFDWKTTKDVQITLSANANGIVEVMNSQQIAYQKAFLTPAQPYVMKLTIPSFEKSVKLRFQGKEASLEIGSGNLSYNFQ
jgi:hypothetical protein